MSKIMPGNIVKDADGNVGIVLRVERYQQPHCPVREDIFVRWGIEPADVPVIPHA